MSGGALKKIRTAVRVRPTIGNELSDNGIVVDTASNTISVVNPRDPTQHFKFAFQSCYDATSSQQEIYDRDVECLLEHAYSGLTVTIFAYGVTSSGKTHTIQGNATEPGIIPRVIDALFNMKGETDSLAFSYMEIYRDEVYDLLVGGVNAPKLPVRDNAEGKVVVPNLTEAPIESPAQFDKIFSKALKSRSVGATNLNHNSSRSHAILCISITCTEGFTTRTGIINLVDLAGSENNKLTGNDPARMLESSAINKSLSTLGQVVHALNSGHSRIPYRDSKLTRILQDALGGSSVGLLICNLAPGSKFRTDTLNTLNFAARTKEIENRPTINEKDNRPVPKPHFAAVAPSKPPPPVRSAMGFKAPTALAVPSAPSTSTLKTPFTPRVGLAGYGRLPRPSLAPGASLGLVYGGAAAIAENREKEKAAERERELERAIEKEREKLREEERERERRREEEREVERMLEREREEEKERVREEERELEKAKQEEREEAWRMRQIELENKITRAVEEEVAKRLAVMEAERTTSLRATPEPEAMVASSSTSFGPPPAYEGTPETMEVKKRLEALERKHELQSTDEVLIRSLSPTTKKKNAQAYLVLARQHQENGDLDTALVLYRRAQQFIPQNAKLQVRIDEVELALENVKKGQPIPETVLNRGTRSKRSAKARPAPIEADESTSTAGTEAPYKSRRKRNRAKANSALEEITARLDEDERIDRTLDGEDADGDDDAVEGVQTSEEEGRPSRKKKKRGAAAGGENAKAAAKARDEDEEWKATVKRVAGKRKNRKGRA